MDLSYTGHRPAVDLDAIPTSVIRQLHLRGAARHDPGGLDQLLGAAADEARTAAPDDPAVIQDIALTWVASRWLDDHDTRAAICTLARLGETNLDLNLGHFIGLDDEWSGGWGRLRPVLKAEADKTLADILNRPMIRHNPNGARFVTTDGA
jgi:hypothetical protein